MKTGFDGFEGQSKEQHVKVWVLSYDYGHEGCSEPMGAYSSLELAQAAARERLKTDRSASDVEVFEMAVDGDVAGHPTAVFRLNWLKDQE